MVLPFVSEWFAVQTVAIKKSLIWYHFLYLNGLQCKPLTIRQMLSFLDFVLESNLLQLSLRKAWFL